MKGAPTDLRSRASDERKNDREREGESRIGHRRRDEGGWEEREGLDRLIYLPSDQPTYLPTNLPTSDAGRRLPRREIVCTSDRDGVLVEQNTPRARPRGTCNLAGSLTRR